MSDGGNLLTFDLETTGPEGPDPYRDRIVSMAFELWTGEEPYPDQQYYRLVHPGDDNLPIPLERTEVHGISTEVVESQLTFRNMADEVQAMVDAADYLCGYSSRTYDVVILHRELTMAGRRGLDTDEKGNIVQPEVDLYRVWQAVESRTLEGAALRFAGKELGEDAHSADADTQVLLPILMGMCEQWGLWEYMDTGLSPSFDWAATLAVLAELSAPPDEVDRAGKFVRDEEGVVRFNFSSHAGKPALSEPGMLRWMLGKDFPPDTKAVCRQLLAGQ